MACNPDCQGPCCNLAADARYVAMANRLGKLRISQLAEIIEQVEAGRVLFDSYNYHQGKFCPMAIAFGLHRAVINSSLDDGVIRYFLAKELSPEKVNILKGVPGNFYHGTDEERKKDLLWLCRELIKSKL